MLQESSLELSLVPFERAPRQYDGSRSVDRSGPGWFDSSWDLQRGLEVRESWFGDDRLHGWIEELLRAQRPAGRTASPSASTAIA